MEASFFWFAIAHTIPPKTAKMSPAVAPMPMDAAILGRPLMITL